MRAMCAKDFFRPRISGISRRKRLEHLLAGMEFAVVGRDQLWRAGIFAYAEASSCAPRFPISPANTKPCWASSAVIESPREDKRVPCGRFRASSILREDLYGKLAGTRLRLGPAQPSSSRKRVSQIRPTAACRYRSVVAGGRDPWRRRWRRMVVSASCTWREKDVLRRSLVIQRDLCRHRSFGLRTAQADPQEPLKADCARNPERQWLHSHNAPCNRRISRNCRSRTCPHSVVSMSSLKLWT